MTEQHKDGKKVKSSATTQLVSEIIFSDSRKVSYEYDPEERITKVTDSVDGVTEYTYDALGQLLTETVNGELVNSMEYDNYGNIKSKNGVAYTYGDTIWKDLLTGYGGWDIGKWEFSTHKYVEDFFLVKNLEQDNYQFVIEFDRLGNATEIKCEPYKTSGAHADMDMSVVSSTHVASTNARFTIADLEEYFSNREASRGSTSR